MSAVSLKDYVFEILCPKTTINHIIQSKMVAQGDQIYESSFISLSDLLRQIETNKKHLKQLESPRKNFFKRLGSFDSFQSSGSDRELLLSTSPHTSSSNASSSTTLMKVSTSMSNLVPNRLYVELPIVRTLDVDPDTYMLLCLPFPVITLRAICRKINSWFQNVFWSWPPMPCVTTTCGPIHHVKSCEFHPLTGSLPYNKPIRRSISLGSMS